MNHVTYQKDVYRLEHIDPKSLTHICKQQPFLGSLEQDDNSNSSITKRNNNNNNNNDLPLNIAILSYVGLKKLKYHSEIQIKPG
jgi:hypothetical protein